MIRDIPARLGGLMDKRGVTVIREKGSFAGPDTVKAGNRLLKARHIVIATGSRPRELPIPGAELLATSDELLNETRLPGEIVFIGGGVIALEFSHVMRRAGAKVTILEALPRLLGQTDADAVAQLRRESERIGIDILTEVTVRGIERAGKRLKVKFAVGGVDRELTADCVANGAGRVADVAGLDLAAAGVKHDRGRIEVDEFLRSTGNPNVYVCGDALWSSPQLSPVATYEGGIVGRNIVDGARHRPDYSAVPACVFTIPALASVGLSEAKAAEAGLRFKTRTSDMSGWLSARTFAEPAAWSKILVEEDTDRILGAHIFGHSGEELIHLFALAIRLGITATQLTAGVYGFPTFSADIKSMV
jgi:glutathione reductase (NADPH)